MIIRRGPFGEVPSGKLRRLAGFMIRMALICVYWQRGAQYNKYGSVVSPSELYIQRDKQLGIRARQFCNLMSPANIPSGCLKRFGPIGDGGYFLPWNILDHAQYLISCGIGSNNDFEIDLAQRGFKGIQIDNSISKAPKLHNNLTFRHQTLGGKTGVTIGDLVNDHAHSEKFVLKLDIEGSEYGVLEDFHDLNRFKAIIIEFHFLHLISETVFWNNIKEILHRFHETHTLAYINPNNYSGFSVIGGVPIPITMEVLFVFKGVLSANPSDTKFEAHPENQVPSNPDWAQLMVTHFFQEDLRDI